MSKLVHTQLFTHSLMSAAITPTPDYSDKRSVGNDGPPVLGSKSSAPHAFNSPLLTTSHETSKTSSADLSSGTPRPVLKAPRSPNEQVATPSITSESVSSIILSLGITVTDLKLKQRFIFATQQIILGDRLVALNEQLIKEMESMPRPSGKEWWQHALAAVTIVCTIAAPFTGGASLSLGAATMAALGATMGILELSGGMEKIGTALQEALVKAGLPEETASILTIVTLTILPALLCIGAGKLAMKLKNPLSMLQSLRSNPQVLSKFQNVVYGIIATAGLLQGVKAYMDGRNELTRGSIQADMERVRGSQAFLQALRESSASLLRQSMDQQTSLSNVISNMIESQRSAETGIAKRIHA